MKRNDLITLIITCAACAGMVGDLTGMKALEGLGAASVIAPMPKVFCDNEGLEGFASDFWLSVSFEDGSHQTMPITPEIYSKLKGPYNRRNVYGAALSYAPRLPKETWQSVFNYGFAPNGPLLNDFGFSKKATNASVIVTTKTKGRNYAWTLESQ